MVVRTISAMSMHTIIVIVCMQSSNMTKVNGEKFVYNLASLCVPLTFTYIPDFACFTVVTTQHDHLALVIVFEILTHGRHRDDNYIIEQHNIVSETWSLATCWRGRADG